MRFAYFASRLQALAYGVLHLAASWPRPPAEVGGVAEPRFSIVTPVYDTPPDVLRGDASTRCARQTLRRLGAVPGRRRLDRAARRGVLEAAERDDPRIRVERRERERRHRRRLQRRAGDGPRRVRRPARPRRRAPARCAGLRRRGASTSDPEADYVYTDEDKLDLRRPPLGPFFKPDWSPERLRTQMYTCHLCVLRRAPRRGGRRLRPGVRRRPGLGPGAPGDRAGTDGRAHAASALPLAHARDLGRRRRRGRKPWAFEAGQRAVQAHCDRIGLQARVERDPERPRRLPPRAALRGSRW